MERAMTMTTVVVLATMAALFIAGVDACDNVPSLTWNMTCDMACKTPHLFDVCKETLKDSPYISEMTIYAVAAATHATKTYDDTVAQVTKTITGGLPGDERGAYETCIERYATARVQMEAAIADMNSCRFGGTSQEYAEAVAAVKACGDSLKAGWPLVAAVAADLDVTTVAANLGALVIGTSGSKHGS